MVREGRNVRMVIETAPLPIQMKCTKLLGQIERAWLTGKRRVWIEGGTYASKTWSVMQLLKFIASKHPEPLHITVISETVPHLKQGAMLDFRNIMGDDFRESCWNKTDFIYRWPTTGSWMQFLSADQPSKATGPRRDVLFVNQPNHLPKEVFRQADMRTHIFTIADWNPEGEFWFHQEECDKVDDEYVLKDQIGAVYIRTSYLDALEVLPPGKQHDIEELKDKDPNGWRVYGLGLLGKITNLVYPNFEQVDELPSGIMFYGLDFGSLADPTVLTAHVIVGDKLYSKELFYEYDAEMTNNKISMKMQLAKIGRPAPIYPDPDEPKSMTELRQMGWNIGETVKGKGSVEFGIKAVNNLFQHWTKDSLNCIKEQRNFRYVLDRNGNLTDNTTHRWSHGLDSRRYAVASHSTKPSIRKSKRSNTW